MQGGYAVGTVGQRQPMFTRFLPPWSRPATTNHPRTVVCAALRVTETRPRLGWHGRTCTSPTSRFVPKRLVERLATGIILLGRQRSRTELGIEFLCCIFPQPNAILLDSVYYRACFTTDFPFFPMNPPSQPRPAYFANILSKVGIRVCASQNENTSLGPVMRSC